MMSSQPENTIQAVEIENFRGFRARQRFDLDASAIVVAGSNGHGKTSFFDALQWVLLGTVPRLATLAGKRSGEYIANTLAGGEPAEVILDLAVGGQSVQLRRRGTSKSSSFEFRDAEGLTVGKQAEAALSQLLLTKYRDDFLRTATEKLLTYALGRGVEYYDYPTIRSINREAAAGSLPKETAVPLALALNELLTNAAMHGAMIVAASLSKWS